MTALSIVQDAAKRIGISVPDALFSETSRTAKELQYTLNDAAKFILKDHDWTDLKTLQTMNGDGSTTQFAVPSDYDRMIRGGKMWSSEYETPLGHIIDSDEWLEKDVRSYSFLTGIWHKLGSNIEIDPAPASGETVKYYYISNLIAAPNGGGSNKASFTLDDDTFVLDERLLTLCVIWRWLASKGRPYSEEMTDYETFKAQLINEDGGAKRIYVGRKRIVKGLRVSYPREVSA